MHTIKRSFYFLPRPELLTIPLNALVRMSRIPLSDALLANPIAIRPTFLSLIYFLLSVVHALLAKDKISLSFTPQAFFIEFDL